MSPAALPAVVVDLHQLLEVVEAAVIAGVGISIAFSLVIFGAVRAGEHRTRSRPLLAGAHALLAIVAFAVCVGAIVFGVTVMLAK